MVFIGSYRKKRLLLFINTMTILSLRTSILQYESPGRVKQSQPGNSEVIKTWIASPKGQAANRHRNDYEFFCGY